MSGAPRNRRTTQPLNGLVVNAYPRSTGDGSGPRETRKSLGELPLIPQAPKQYDWLCCVAGSSKSLFVWVGNPQPTRLRSDIARRKHLGMLAESAAALGRRSAFEHQVPVRLKDSPVSQGRTLARDLVLGTVVLCSLGWVSRWTHCPSAADPDQWRRGISQALVASGRLVLSSDLTLQFPMYFLQGLARAGRVRPSLVHVT